jgi:hypothetical protein
VGADYSSEVLQAAKAVVLEINPNMPFTFGATLVHTSQVRGAADGPGSTHGSMLCTCISTLVVTASSQHHRSSCPHCAHGPGLRPRPRHHRLQVANFLFAPRKLHSTAPSKPSTCPIEQNIAERVRTHDLTVQQVQNDGSWHTDVLPGHWVIRVPLCLCAPVMMPGVRAGAGRGHHPAGDWRCAGGGGPRVAR